MSRVSTSSAGRTRLRELMEQIALLGELPPRGAFFMFLPIKVKGASGGLGRAVAFV